jgi:hypothetical protein
MNEIEGLKGLEYYKFLKELNQDVKNKELFIKKYTRKDCYKILKRINLILIKQKPEYAQQYAFSSMTKERAYKHINFYFELHGYNRIKC